MSNDPNVIRGKDKNGYFVKERVCIHTDEKPDEWVTTYYEPFEKEGE